MVKRRHVEVGGEEQVRCEVSGVGIAGWMRRRICVVLLAAVALLAVLVGVVLVASIRGGVPSDVSRADLIMRDVGESIIMPPLDIGELTARAEELFTVKSVPRIYLTAEAPITSKEVYKPLSVRIVDDVVPENNYSDLSGEIQARGNSTYELGLEYGMMPYKIKLDTKTNLFGLGEHRKWCLLANFIDRSYVRQFVSFGLARILRDDAYYQPKAKFAEVYLNNEYQGLYLLAESVEEDDGALDIEVNAMAHDDDMPFLLEVENVDSINIYYDREANTYFGQPFADYLFYADSEAEKPEWLLDGDLSNDNQYPAVMILKYPDGFSSVLRSQAENIRDSVRSVYFGLRDNLPLDQLEIDAASFVDSLIFCNVVLSVSCKSGPSQYIYREPYDRRIKAGPLWDFDRNMIQDRTGKLLLSKDINYFNIDDNALVNGLLRNETFVAALMGRYKDYYRDILPIVNKYVKALRENQTLKAAVLRSEEKYRTWGSDIGCANDKDHDKADEELLSLATYEEHVDHIHEWLFGKEGGQFGRVGYLNSGRAAWLPYEE